MRMLLSYNILEGSVHLRTHLMEYIGTNLICYASIMFKVLNAQKTHYEGGIKDWESCLLSHLKMLHDQMMMLVSFYIKCADIFKSG